MGEEGWLLLDPLWQYQIPLWALFLLFAALLLIPTELGFRLGKRHHEKFKNVEGEARNDISLTSMLALLGLMLAFTYSFSMSRADLRKVEVIKETNALSTAFLRADLLSEPGRTEVRRLVYDYAKSRLVDRGTLRTRADVQAVVNRSLEVQAKIWPAVKSALHEAQEMTGPEKALLISSINDVLDAHTSKMAVFFDRLPTAVLALLVLIAGGSLGLAAYNYALQDRFRRWRLNAFALILATLMYIILDYDMMMRGLIQVDDQSLVLLIKDMDSALDQ